MPKSKGKQTPSRPKAKSKTKTVPVAFSYRGATTAGSFGAGKPNGSIRIRRTEFVGTVSNGSVTGYSMIGLSAQTPGYDFNPAHGTLFPWLAGIAPYWERFIFHQLKFRIIPSQATSTAGRLYLAVDYDWDDEPAVSKLSLMSNQTKVEGPVWDQLILDCIGKELHSDGKDKYVSHHLRSNFYEPRTAFCGFLMIAVDSPATDLKFDLEVSYDVELHLPVLDQVDVTDALQGTLGSVASTAFPAICAESFKAGYVCGPLGRGVTQAPPSAGPALAVNQTSSGSGECPVLSWYGDPAYPMSQTARNVFDLKDVSGKTGVFGIGGNIVATGVTPLALRATNEVIAAFQVFDSLGKYLGTEEAGYGFSGSTLKGFMGLFDPRTLTASTATQPLDYTVEVCLKTLFGKYATARFWVPLLLTTAAKTIGAGFLTGSTKYMP